MSYTIYDAIREELNQAPLTGTSLARSLRSMATELSVKEALESMHDDGDVEYVRGVWCLSGDSRVDRSGITEVD